MLKIERNRQFSLYQAEGVFTQTKACKMFGLIKCEYRITNVSGVSLGKKTVQLKGKDDVDEPGDSN